jgi:hypothetical protein
MDLIINKDDSGREGDGSPREAPIVPNAVPSPRSHDERQEYRYPHTPWWKTAAELIGIGAVVFYTYYAHGQWHEMIRAADATKLAADIARDTLIASNRPWMTAEIQITGPLTFGKGQANLPLMYTLKNIGHSPALDVWSDEELYLPINAQRDTETERARLCGETEKRSLTMGQAVFPGADSKGQIVTSVSDIAVQKNIADNKLGGFITPAIVVCIAYRSTIEKDTWHHTGIVYDVWRVDEVGGRYAIMAGTDIPIKELRFTYSLFRPVLAD